MKSFQVFLEWLLGCACPKWLSQSQDDTLSQTVLYIHSGLLSSGQDFIQSFSASLCTSKKANNEHLLCTKSIFSTLQMRESLRFRRQKWASSIQLVRMCVSRETLYRTLSVNFSSFALSNALPPSSVASSRKPSMPWPYRLASPHQESLSTSNWLPPCLYPTLVHWGVFPDGVPRVTFLKLVTGRPEVWGAGWRAGRDMRKRFRVTLYI